MIARVEMMNLVTSMFADDRVGALPAKWSSHEVVKSIAEGDYIEAAYHLGFIARSWGWSNEIKDQIQLVLQKLKEAVGERHQDREGQASTGGEEGSDPRIPPDHSE